MQKVRLPPLPDSERKCTKERGSAFVLLGQKCMKTACWCSFCPLSAAGGKPHFLDTFTYLLLGLCGKGPIHILPSRTGLRTSPRPRIYSEFDCVIANPWLFPIAEDKPQGNSTVRTMCRRMIILQCLHCNTFCLCRHDKKSLRFLGSDSESFLQPIQEAVRF